MADQTLNLSNFVETKLTKGELVELVIADMRSQVKTELRKIEAEIKEISSSFTSEDVFDILEDAKVRIEEGYAGSEPGKYPEKYRIYFEMTDVKAGSFEKPVLTALKRRHDLVQMQLELQKRLGKLSEKGEAKTLVLKGLVEQTPEGKQFLQLLEGIKVKVDTRLLLAAKQEQ